MQPAVTVGERVRVSLCLRGDEVLTSQGERRKFPEFLFHLTWVGEKMCPSIGVIAYRWC